MLRDPSRATVLARTPADETIDADPPSDERPADASSAATDGPLLDAADAGLALRYLEELFNV